MRRRTFTTYPSLRSPGRVHRYVYDRTNKLWHCACRSVSRGDPHGKPTDGDVPITCRSAGCREPS